MFILTSEIEIRVVGTLCLSSVLATAELLCRLLAITNATARVVGTLYRLLPLLATAPYLSRLQPLSQLLPQANNHQCNSSTIVY